MGRTLLLAILLCGLTGCGGDGSSDGQSTASGSTDAPPTQTDVCGADERIAVTVVVDAGVDRVYALLTRLAYPRSVVIPGAADDASVHERVTFIPLQTALDEDRTLKGSATVSNDEDYRLQTVMMALDSFPDGPFVRVTFDCVEGERRPTPDDFSCEVFGTNLQFEELSGESSCHAEVPSRP